MSSSPPRRSLGKLVALAATSLGCATAATTVPVRAVERGSGAAAAPAPTAPSLSPGGALTDAERSSGVVWRFHAGAPLRGGAAVGPGGEVYVGSVEGYLHALGPDGAFRWSYTVRGGIIGAPLVGDDGRVFVATTTRQIYSILPNGRRSWTFRSPVAIVTPIAWTQDDSMVYGGADRHLWAVSSRAGARWRAALAGRISAGPVAAPGGFPVVAVTAEGTVSAVSGAWARWDLDVGGPPSGAPAVLDDGSVAVVFAGKVVFIDPRGRRLWERPGTERVFADGADLLALEGDTLVRLARDGTERARMGVGANPSADPLRLDGYLIVPCSDGSLRAVSDDAGLLGQLNVAPAPLHAPVRVERGVVVAAGDGTVAKVDPERIVGAR